MGKMIITEAVGEGLYRGKLQHNKTALLAEKARLEALNNDYWRQMNDALDVLIALRKERAMARETLDAIIKQWQQALDEKLKPAPPLVPTEANPDGTNPATGQPYTDAERADALEKELRDEINAERALRSRSPLNLDTALSQHSRQRIDSWGDADPYRSLLKVQSLDDAGRRAADRALESAHRAVIRQAEDAIAVGQTSIRGVVDAWKRDTDTWEAMMQPNITALGVGYQRRTDLPGTHGYTAMTAEYADAPAQNTAFFASSAGAALLDDVTQTMGEDAADALKGSGGGGGDAGQWSEAWQANHEYGVGATVMGTRANNGGKILAKNMGSMGLSGSSQPRWPGPGASVADYELVWSVLSDIKEQTALGIQQFYGWTM